MESRLLIVDDDREMREALGGLFGRAGTACELAADASSALDLLDKNKFDAVISDVVMEGMNGLDLLDRIKQSQPALPVVMITGAGRIAQAVEAIKRGAFGYVVKPCGAGELQTIVASALQGQRHSAESVRPSRLPPAPGSAKTELVGAGPAMTALQATIDLVARSSAPVMVTGETGVGKELVSQAIHARSARRNLPFVALNTAAIPQEMLEAEIFGHVRGGFTGAVQARKGLLTEADGGTLLLDEIGDMSFGLQAKLLRVLQSGEVRPVGSDRAHLVDVRLIASTHRDVPMLIKEGRFREDLYFRLNVLSVPVPPLRDHLEDIPALALHFLAQARKRAPLSPVRTIGPEAIRALSDREWPGNVRELGSVIERAVVFGSGESLEPQLFLPASSPGSPLAWPFPSGSPWTLERLSIAYADWVLAQTGGSKQRAAEIMGIDLSTLYRWQRKRRG